MNELLSDDRLAALLELLRKCQSGPNAGKPGVCPEDRPDSVSGTDSFVTLHEQAEPKAHALVRFVSQLPARVYDAAKVRVSSSYRKLAARYGKPTATVIVAAGIAGTATPIPAGGIVAAAPLIAAAELYLRLRAMTAKDFHDFLVRSAKEIQPARPIVLWMARHGKTQYNRGDKSAELMRGWNDVPLDAEGIAEAERLADYFAEKPLRCIYTSNLKRALHTAQIIGERKPGIEIVPTGGLRTWNVGDFTGQLSSVVHPKLDRYIEDRPDESLPGGESFLAFKDRCLSFLEAVLEDSEEEEEPALIVSHFRNFSLVRAWVAAGKPSLDAGAAINVDSMLSGKNLPTGVVLRVEGKEGKWKAETIAADGEPHAE